MRALLIIIILSFSAQPASAKRIALVIGNDAYSNVTPLKKAANDANALALTLGDLGFKVMKEINASRRVMDTRLNELNSRVEAGDEVVVFFAGHGISVRGQNYLLPTDIPKIRPGQERSVTKEAFSENEIINILQERGAKVSILIIDACRNNPFPKSGTRTLGRTVGLGERSTPPRNTFIMYSASIGQEALDRLSEADLDPNSVFTRKLIPLLKTPGLSHVQMAKRLQIEVEQLALKAEQQHRQFPAFYDQVRGNFFFIPADKKQAQPIAKATESPEELLWNTIQNSTTAEDYKFYLRKFPKGRFAHIAELNLQKLTPKPLEKSEKPKEEQKLALLKTPTTREIKLPELSSNELANDKGWIGVRIQDVTDQTYKDLGLEKKTGTLIVSITDNGPASKSYLKKGDVVLSINGKDVGTSRELASLIQAIQPGKKALLKVMREKAARFLSVDVGGFLNINSKLAKVGHLEAMLNLAHHYHFSKDGNQDMTKALAYYQSAANTGDKDSMFQLADFYYKDQGALKKNEAQAFQWFKKAAEKGHILSLFYVGLAYHYGSGTAKDLDKARDYYQRAATNGESTSMNSLAGLYQRGEGTPKNINEAIKWHRKAADKNNQFSALALGILFSEGKEVPENLNAAENYLKIAVDRNNREAKHRLAVIYDNGVNRTKDPATAAKLVYEALKLKLKMSYDSLTNHPGAWSKDFRKEIQKKLKADGHYDGKVDGDFGDGTKDAIKKVYEQKTSVNSPFEKFFKEFMKNSEKSTAEKADSKPLADIPESFKKFFKSQEEIKQK